MEVVDVVDEVGLIEYICCVIDFVIELMIFVIGIEINFVC